MKRKPEIPRADLKVGIQRCFVQARSLLDSSLILVDTEQPDAAANLFVLAVQEIGKAKLLHEAFEAGEPKSRIVDFCDHDVKTEKGISVLGSRAAWLKEGAFNAEVFSDAFDVGVPADEPTRMELLYVNYHAGQWLDPPSLDTSELRARIKEALAQLSAVEDSMVK